MNMPDPTTSSPSPCLTRGPGHPIEIANHRVADGPPGAHRIPNRLAAQLRPRLLVRDERRRLCHDLRGAGNEDGRQIVMGHSQQPERCRSAGNGDGQRLALHSPAIEESSGSHRAVAIRGRRRPPGASATIALADGLDEAQVQPVAIRGLGAEPGPRGLDSRRQLIAQLRGAATCQHQAAQVTEEERIDSRDAWPGEDRGIQFARDILIRSAAASHSIIGDPCISNSGAGEADGRPTEGDPLVPVVIDAARAVPPAGALVAAAHQVAWHTAARQSGSAP